MQRILPLAGLTFGLACLGFATVTVRSADHVDPSCAMCPASYITAEELQAYLAKAMDGSGSLDQQVRSVDAGKANIQIAMVHRGSSTGGGIVAEHSLVTEVYYIISGSGSHRTGPQLVGPVARPAENYAARMLNGPGHNATDIVDAETQDLKAGDVLIIPAGTGHQFTRIEDHITYLMVRVDPDKVVPLMDEAVSRAYLAGGGLPGGG